MHIFIIIVKIQFLRSEKNFLLLALLGKQYTLVKSEREYMKIFRSDQRNFSWP